MTELDGEQRRLTADLMSSAEELLVGADRLAWLARDLADGYVVTTSRVDLEQLVGEVAAVTGAEVRLNVASYSARDVDTDAAVLSQVLCEIVHNAQRHGRPPICVEVRRNRGGDRVEISVSDLGSGMRPEVFAELRGATPATSTGMVLIGSLARRLGASVDATTGPGGTRITLALPAGVAGTAPSTERPEPAPLARDLRVLLVEDNATNRLLAQRQLARLGHELIAVADGRAGVEAALAGVADVVLMDLHLPDIDGREAARAIRHAEQDGDAHLPIIAVTADATPEAAASCLDAGMDEVLTKPVDLDGLAAALDRAAATRRATSQSERQTTADASVGGASPHRSLPSTVRHVLDDTGHHAGLAAELIEVYVGELPGRRLRIQAALRAGRLDGVVAAATSLRTSSESVGATAIAGTCAALCAAAESGDLTSARAFIPMLGSTCERSARELAPFTVAGEIARALESTGR